MSRKTREDVTAARLAQDAHTRGRRILVLQVSELLHPGSSARVCSVDLLNERIAAVEATGLYRFLQLSTEAQNHVAGPGQRSPLDFYVTFEACDPDDMDSDV